MPGNEVGDRVHNFFAQDNLSQGQHNSQAVDGNWPVLSNNLWPGSQRQVGVLNSSSKGYNLPQSDSERGLVGNPLHGSHGLTFTQPNTRPEFAKSQSQSQPNFNGFMYGNQFYQTRPDESNFLAVDTNSDQRNLTQRGISAYGSPQVGAENQGKSSVRSETSGSPVGYDFFGGPQQMNHQQLSMLQSLQHQPSGLNVNDMQQLQQQVILMKMQELQRQQQLQQIDTRQQSLMNSPFAKASGSQSPTLINGSLNSDALSYQLPNDLGNPNWMQRNPLAMQGSSNGLVFSPNQGLAHRMVDLVPHQVEQSLYGVPISSSRGSLNPYPHMATEKPSVQQLTNTGNFLPGNQYNTFPGQVKLQERASIARQRFLDENSFGHASGHAVSTAMDMGNVHQINSLQRNADMPDTSRRQEQPVPPDTIQETTDTQNIPSRDDVALDPTEERILFGSDDNIWAAFGKSPNMGGDGSNLFDGVGLNGISSIQSGSWSALMQSAVAETSSSDMGLHEEWSGVNFQNIDIASVNQHTLSGNDGGKQHPPLADENLAISSSFGARSVPPTGGSNVNKNHQNLLGFQQFGRKISNETSQRVSTNPSQALDLLSDPGGRWSNGIPGRKSVAEGGSQMHGNAPHSLDAESSGSTRLYTKPNGWNAFGSVTPYGDAALTVQGNESSLQHSENTEQKRMMQREVVDGGGVWKSNPGQDTRLELEQVKSSRGSSVMNREGFSLNNAAVLSDSSNIKAGEASSQFLPNNYQLNYWKNVDPLVKSKVGEVVGGSQQENIYSSKYESKGHEMENSDKQENSNDSYRSNSHHTSAGGPKENAGSDAIDSRALSTGKQKLSNQIARKHSSSRKFQYHPMGNLDDDVETPQGMKQPIFPPAMSHFGQSKFLGQVPKNSIEAGKGQSPELQRSTKGFDESMSPVIFSGSIPNKSASFNRSVEKFSPDKASQSSQNMLELLHKVDQSKEHTAVMHAIASDPNAASKMLQAENADGSVGRLQRSQSSNSQGFGLQLGPPMQRLPIGNQSLSSQSPLHMGSSSQSTHAVSEIGQKGQAHLVPLSSQSVPSSRERSQGESNRSGVSLQTSNEISLDKLPGNFSAFNSGFPHPRGPLQSQEIAWASGQLSRSLDKHASTQKNDHDKPPASESARASLPDEAGGIPYSNSVSPITHQNSVNILPGKVLAQQISAGKPLPFSQPSSIPNNPLLGTSSKPLPNMWNNVAAHQQSLAAEFQKVSSQISQLNQRVANSTSASLSQGEPDGKRGNFPSEFSENTANSHGILSEEEPLIKENSGQQESSENVINWVQKIKESQGKEPVVRTSSDGSPANSLSTQRDIEAFGRSLKPNNLFQQNYSLLNQMRSLKNAEDDPSNRVLKRMKGPDSGLGSQLVPPMVTNSNDLNAIVGDALVPRATIPSVDPGMLGFTAPENNMEANASSQHGNLAAQGALTLSRDGSHSSSTATSSKVDILKISPQMAPSWFNQYGNFKNGQILPMYEQATIVKTAEQPLTFGKSSSSLHTLNSMEPLATANVDVNQVGDSRQSTTPSVAVDYLSSHLFPSSASGQQPLILRSKKRKSCTSELDPWHKEVSQGSRCLQTISMADVEWAKAANRLIDKVGEDVDMLEDGSLMLKPKRRLVLTTHLMQKLLPPPSAAILSSDASLDYESMVYSISRLALGGACSMVSLASSKSNMPVDITNRHSDEYRISERVDNHLLLKTIDDFMSRARKLENEFLRLDKRASVLDLIVECQDLEKFSVINRFAKFHGRGQADSAEASSSSDAAANTQKPYPQRYVTALPLPRNLPTKVQCCSL